MFKESSKVKVKPRVKNNNNKKIDGKINDGETEEVEDEMDIVVYLHEDVADSALGGGNSGHVCEDLAEGYPDVVDSDVADPDAADPDAVDPDVGDSEPADLVPASDGDDTDDDEYDPGPQPLRKSVRFSRAPKVFSYDEIGGPPVLIDIKSNR